MKSRCLRTLPLLALIATTASARADYFHVSHTDLSRSDTVTGVAGGISGLAFDRSGDPREIVPAGDVRSDDSGNRLIAMFTPEGTGTAKAGGVSVSEFGVADLASGEYDGNNPSDTPIVKFTPKDASLSENAGQDDTSPGLEPRAVDEPKSLALTGLGGLAILAWTVNVARRRKPRRSNGGAGCDKGAAELTYRCHQVDPVSESPSLRVW